MCDQTTNLLKQFSCRRHNIALVSLAPCMSNDDNQTADVVSYQTSVIERFWYNITENSTKCLSQKGSFAPPPPVFLMCNGK